MRRGRVDLSRIVTGELAQKRIIYVHGLGSKPPRDIAHDLWRHTLIENIRVANPALADRLEDNPAVCESAYWADVIPHHIPDDAAYCRKLRIQVERVIAERREIQDAFHVGLGEKLGWFFKDRGIDLVKLIAGALAVKDEVMTRFLRETELYAEDQYISDQMRAPLEQALRRAWNEGRDVAIITHSMGSFIAFDVLWRFSHRQTDGFADYGQRRVQMFVTLGSPLGDHSVRDLLFARYHEDHDARRFPSNIDFWHNYACLGDVVAHQKNFDEIFYAPMRELGLFPRRRRFRSIDYADLHNPFEVVGHQGNRHRNRRNPHKSYGYLVQPRLGTWIEDFLLGRLR